MSARDSLSIRLPLGAILVILLCVCSLAVHFVGASIVWDANASGSSQAQALDVDDPDQDDAFIPASLNSSVECSCASGLAPLALRPFTYTSLPQLPPPNL